MFKGKNLGISLVVGTVVFFSVLLFGLNRDRTFLGETDIIVLPKSESANRNLSQIVANAKTIPFSLSFYNKLIERYPDLEDGAMEKSDALRKAYWQEKIALNQKGESGIIEVTAKDDNRFQAELLSQKTAEDIKVIMGRYYDMEKDVEIHVVDGPIVMEKTKNISWLIVLMALLGGLLGALILGGAWTILAKIFQAISQKLSRTSFPEKNTFDLNEAEKSTVNQELPLFQEELPFLIEKKENIEKENVDDGKKAPAPENLPVVDGGEIGKIISEEHQIEAIRKEEALLGEEKKEDVPTAVNDQHKREATPEEIRERLNKLLRGGK